MKNENWFQVIPSSSSSRQVHFGMENPMDRFLDLSSEASLSLIFRVAKTCAGRGSRGTIMFKALVISVQRRRWGRGPRVQWLSGPEGPSFSLCSKTRFHTRQSPGSSIDCRLPQKGTKEWMEIFCKTYPSFFSKGLSVGDIQGITNSTNSQVLL